MRVDLAAITDEALRNLAQLYQYDFAQFIPAMVDDTGRFTMISIDAYLDERSERVAIRADGDLAGFAICSHGEAFRDQHEQVWWMDEFFVMRQHRRRGVGAGAATMLFDRFPGSWEVGQVRENAPAQAFWRQVIGRYTDGAFDEIDMDDDRWVGPVQCFETK